MNQKSTSGNAKICIGLSDLVKELHRSDIAKIYVVSLGWAHRIGCEFEDSESMANHAGAKPLMCRAILQWLMPHRTSRSGIAIPPLVLEICSEHFCKLLLTNFTTTEILLMRGRIIKRRQDTLLSLTDCNYSGGPIKLFNCLLFSRFSRILLSS